MNTIGNRGLATHKVDQFFPHIPLDTFAVIPSSLRPMDPAREYQSNGSAGYDIMTPRTYIFGAIMLVLGALGVYMMVALPKVYPLLSIFFYMIPSNVAIAIFPHEPVIIGYGKTMNLYLLASSATLGTLLSAYLDYKFFAPLLNLSYSEKFRARRGYQKAQEWFSKMPFVIVILASFLPVPFYPFKFVAISSKYPMPRFMGAMAVGRFPRYYLLGLLGHALQIPNWILFAMFFGMFGLIYYKKIWGLISWPFVALSKSGANGKSES